MTPKPILRLLTFFLTLFLLPALILGLIALITWTPYKVLMNGALQSGAGAALLFVVGLICAWYIVDETFKSK